MPTLSRRSLILSGALAGLLPSVLRAEDVQPAAPSTPAAADTPKPPQLSAAQQLEHVSVLLRTENRQKQLFSGTGFFYNFFRSDNQSVTAIVTNRHVLANMTKVQMRLTRKNASNLPDFGNYVDVALENLDSRVIFHPDPDVDLAILAISDVLNAYENNSKPIYAVGMDQSLVSSESDLKNFQPIEEVLIVGYPDGVSDTANNIPISRRGITATPVYMRFNNEKRFMIDAAIYHGSSGSPVFLYNVGAWVGQNNGMQLGTRVALLGVVYGVMESETEGEIRIVPAPTQLAAKSVSKIPHSLGACIPAYCILDFEPEIVKQGYKPPEGYKMRAQP
jgi:S1-C subfamily serine protease